MKTVYIHIPIICRSFLEALDFNYCLNAQQKATQSRIYCGRSKVPILYAHLPGDPFRSTTQFSLGHLNIHGQIKAILLDESSLK